MGDIFIAHPSVLTAVPKEATELQSVPSSRFLSLEGKTNGFNQEKLLMRFFCSNETVLDKVDLGDFATSWIMEALGS